MANCNAKGIRILLHPELLVLLCTLLLLRFRVEHHVTQNIRDGQVRLLIGVVTHLEKIERRHLIRHLYPYSFKNASSTIAADIIRTVFVIG